MNATRQLCLISSLIPISHAPFVHYFVMMPVIAKADPDEAPALTAIAHQAKRAWGYPEAWILAWREALTLDRHYLLTHIVNAIRDHNDLLGFYSLVALDRSQHQWELDHLWLVPTAMGRGLGRALFEHAVGQARLAGARRLRILSDPNAEPFYHRMGAQTVGRVDASIGGVERWLPEMELRLGSRAGADSAEGP